MTRVLSTEVLDYLTANYQQGEPIFLKDIQEANLGISVDNLRHKLGLLCSKDLLRSYGDGVYGLPWLSEELGESWIAPELIMHAKYVARRGKVFGYYSGANAANIFNLSTQMPYKATIVTNATSAKFKEIRLKHVQAVIKKAPTEVTDDNYSLLQLLDTVRDIKIWPELTPEESAPILREYIVKLELKQKDLLKCIKFYSAVTYKNLVDMELYDAFLK